MDEIQKERREQSLEVVPVAHDFGEAATEICENALNEAKQQLHPLLRNSNLDHLHKRSEFIQAFELVLERRIAQKLALW